VVWTTQRIEEIQGLADDVSVLVNGELRFRGTVLDLAAQVSTQSYVLTVQNGGASGHDLLAAVRDALRGRATASLVPGEDGERFVVRLEPGVVLGDAFSALATRELTLVACREERPGIEQAFLSIASGEAR
jgi:ABC-type multidrug transport system ATPase subunit